MRKLIFILFPIFSYGQITITKATTAGEHNCSAVGIVGIQHNNIPLTSGKLYLAVLFADSTNVYGSNVGSTSFTWDTVAQTGNFDRRIAIYRCLPTSSTTTDDPIISFPFGNYPNLMDFTIWEITGVELGANGANAVLQAVTANATSSTTASVTMGGLLNSRSSVLTAFTNSLSPFGGSPESGWTEQFDVGCTTFPSSTNISGQYIMTRIGTTDNTPSATISSSDWYGIAIEIRAAGRRAVIVN